MVLFSFLNVDEAVQVNVPLEKLMVFPCIKALCSDISELRY